MIIQIQPLKIPLVGKIATQINYKIDNNNEVDRCDFTYSVLDEYNNEISCGIVSLTDDDYQKWNNNQLDGCDWLLKVLEVNKKS